ncbi:MAG TPA: S8 family serine peptidase, partial [Pyrinomonadaceae bacterium]|nr:S8 family serine peptidase [Pyrinomonadaceae bacterium]
MNVPKRLVLTCLALALLGSLIPVAYIRNAKAQKKSPAKSSQTQQDAGNKNDETAPSPGQDNVQTEQISESARLQIESLIRDKQSRTPTQRKIDSQLLYATKQKKGIPVSDAVTTLDLNVEVDDSGRTLVDIRAKVTKSVLNLIKQSGGTVVSYFKQYDSIRADLPLEALESIAAQPEVRFIRPADVPKFNRMPAPTKTDAAVRSANPTEPRALPDGFAGRAALVRERLSNALAAKGVAAAAVDDEFVTHIGSANSQGDTTHNTVQARNFYGLNGKGIKIGVISDSFNLLGGYNNDVASGDLPGTGNPNGYTTPVTVLQEAAAGGGNDEGRAMAQIIHDVVPGARLYFATANGGVANFAANITALSNAGCDIIVDDVSYFTESPFQNDAIGNAVDAVMTAGKMYFSSVGNEGNLNDNTSGTWEGDYVDAGALTVGTAGTLSHVNDFDTTAAVSKTNAITSGNGQPITLYWTDPLGAASNDYDLYVLKAASTSVVAASTGDQTGTQDPFEGTGSGNTTGNRIVIDKFTGSARFLHLDATGGLLTFKTAGEARGHAATSTGYAVAATPAVGPFPATFNSSNQVENFSSDGPRRVFYNPNGTAITPGNVSSTGGAVKQKPEITAADGVSTTVSALFNPFFGTSAASPHAAAIAALIKSSNASLTQSQILTAMKNTAIDIEAAGVDRDAGFGIVMPLPALSSLGAAPGATIALGSATATITSGCDALANGGEKGNLTVQLTNVGGAGATGISAVLAPVTPGLVVTQGSSI